MKSRREAWIVTALVDIRNHRASTWRARRDQLTTLLRTATSLLEELDAVINVRLTVNDPDPLVPLARAVRAHIAGAGRIKTDAAGRPKLGTLSPRVLKQAASLFDAVRVDGVPPTTEAALTTFINWVDATRSIEALDRAWPTGTEVPAEDTLSERIQWHIAEVEELERVLRFADLLEAYERDLVDLGLPPGNWTDPAQMTVLTRVMEAVSSRELLITASAAIVHLEDACSRASRWSDASPCVRALHTAVQARDANSYRSAHMRLHELLRVRELLARRDELESRLAGVAPALHSAVRADPGDPGWGEKLDSFSAAWRWAAVGSWLRRREQLDVNALDADFDTIEHQIRSRVEGLSATRAWAHATSPQRITGQARANLQHYAQLVKRLGKGTGKYAGQKRADIRSAMDRCRSSVPVWILPLYRIAEQLRVAPDMFDVVIVDEASQAGLEATFLQYLAPKIVVIGDDKQVSPAAVGLDQQQLRDLAAQYLHDDPYRASWSDPLRSLFDEAKMRYGGLITLVEHRRCVPEIIGFSNRVAYEPDGVRLIPVRQYGADRLEPIKPVFLPDGYTKGTSSKINPVEVEAIVDQLSKCLADPRYDGLTFGVVSLLGAAQAKEIEKALLDRIPSEEWSARDLRCGDSADFQGSERDVMFLSMVAAPEPGKRLIPLTRDTYLQRYNVAASRAKDQMWVFHSVSLDELTNLEDMRFALLDYCYGVAKRLTSGSDGMSTPVPEDTRVTPFDSLFEQRVFNRLVDRGYSVVPQYEVEGYCIDLVVVGSSCKLAVECDGDAWHGRDAYEHDLARQRELERCGWRFFRIPEFRFYVDRVAALAPLWDLLEDLDIHPSGWTRPVTTNPAATDLSRLPTPAAAPMPPLARSQVHPFLPVDKSAGAPHQFGDDQDEDSDVELEQLDEVNDESTTAIARVGHELFAINDNPKAPLPTSEQVLMPYSVFSGRATPALVASRAQLVDELVAIVAVEGPIIGDRLHQIHVTAAGGQRVGRQIAQALNRAVSYAVRNGKLLADSPLGDHGVKPTTYRLPDQAPVTVRTRGPRSLEQIPPAELAVVMANAACSCGWADEDALFRATLERYGWVRLGSNVVAHLRRIKTLAEN